MTLDPQAKAYLDYLVAHNVPPMHKLTPGENRIALTKIIKRMRFPAQTVAQIHEQALPVPDGEIKVRVYSPAAKVPLPVLVYFHGGGFIMGDLDMVDYPLKVLTNAIPSIVISVDYRLAPEHKFPTAVEDCYLATKWAAENARTFGGDPGRMAVGGDSAGGNLAAVVSLACRERGGPSLCFQVLLYPSTDQLNDYPSRHEFAQGYFITLDDIKSIQSYYLRTEEDKKNIFASPILAEDLSGLPPALVVTAGYDPLRDEGKAYADRLKEAGVQVEYSCYAGMIHGFFGMAGIMDQGKDLIRQVAKSLQTAFYS